MEASSKGAGRDNSIGVNIELPFEHGTNAYVDVKNRHIATSYFFTRKVIMTRSSQAFVSFPGGVGTMDELFEILTLLHTGKTDPVPVVLVDQPGGTFWSSWSDFMDREVVAEGYLSLGDDVSYYLCDNVEDAVAEITTFYANYVSCVTGNGEAMVTVRFAPSDEEFARLCASFANLSFTWAAALAARRSPLVSTGVVTPRCVASSTRSTPGFSRHRNRARVPRPSADCDELSPSASRVLGLRRFRPRAVGRVPRRR